MEKIGGWYISPEHRAAAFAEMVADIVSLKLSGSYENSTPEVVGGWAISAEKSELSKAEAIANTVVDRIGVRA